jgi:hypothetical protein
MNPLLFKKQLAVIVLSAFCSNPVSAQLPMNKRLSCVYDSSGNRTRMNIIFTYSLSPEDDTETNAGDRTADDGFRITRQSSGDKYKIEFPEGDSDMLGGVAQKKNII